MVPWQEWVSESIISDTRERRRGVSFNPSFTPRVSPHHPSPMTCVDFPRTLINAYIILLPSLQSQLARFPDSISQKSP